MGKEGQPTSFEGGQVETKKRGRLSAAVGVAIGAVAVGIAAYISSMAGAEGEPHVCTDPVIDECPTGTESTTPHTHATTESTTTTEGSTTTESTTTTSTSTTTTQPGSTTTTTSPEQPPVTPSTVPEVAPPAPHSQPEGPLVETLSQDLSQGFVFDNSNGQTVRVNFF